MVTFNKNDNFRHPMYQKISRDWVLRYIKFGRVGLHIFTISTKFERDVCVKLVARRPTGTVPEATGQGKMWSTTSIPKTFLSRHRRFIPSLHS